MKNLGHREWEAIRTREAPSTTPQETLSRVTYDQIILIHEKAAVGTHRGLRVNDPRQVLDLLDVLHAGGNDPVTLIARIFDRADRDPQPFEDCNHRTAMALGRLVAKAFGQTLRFSEGQGRALRARWSEMTLNDFKAWIRLRLVTLKGL